MNLLTINIVSSCNKSCYYCPTKRWHNDIDYKFPFLNDKDTSNLTEEQKEQTRKKLNALTNDSLLKWLDSYLGPKEWLIEITGGEPGLYPEVQTLITELNNRNYFGLVKTNGSLPIPKSNNFKIISCWHYESDFPEYFDEVIIIRNPQDDWHKKLEYCKENNIIFHTTLFDEWYATGKYINPERCKLNHIINYCHINSMGQISGCSREIVNEERNIFNMSRPIIKNVSKECPKCKNINDVEMFLPDTIKLKIGVL